MRYPRSGRVSQAQLSIPVDHGAHPPAARNQMLISDQISFVFMYSCFVYEPGQLIFDWTGYATAPGPRWFSYMD